MSSLKAFLVMGVWTIAVLVGLYLGWIGLALVGGFLFIIARAMQKNSTI